MFCIGTLFNGAHEISAQIEIKANVPLAAVLIPNIGVGFQVGKKTSLQLDTLGSFWNSIGGAPLHISQTFLEFRYYSKTDISGWFVGAHLGFGMFTFQKPNDFIIYPRYSTTKDAEGVYKSGRSTFHGLSFGYKKRLNKRWALELFLEGGYAMSHYKGYKGMERIDVDEDNYRPFNKSGEVLLYRGGLMVSYKIFPYKKDKE